MEFSSQVGIINIGNLISFSSGDVLINNFQNQKKVIDRPTFFDYYNSSLSEKEMETIYRNQIYSNISYRDFHLPYTILSLFFNYKDITYLDFNSVSCNFIPSSNTFITNKSMHPLNDSSLLDCLSSAYKYRRWDNLENWNKLTINTNNRKLIKICSFDLETKNIDYCETDYDTQAVTNLVIDMEVNNKTLRSITLENGKLPTLSNKYLANSLGISVLFLSNDGHPILPLRNKDGVAIFPNEWGCTSSFAVNFPDNHMDTKYLYQLIDFALTKQLKNEFNIDPSKINIIPLALCREWFRGGKPQLFMAVESPFTIIEAKQRYKDSLHSIEVAAAYSPVFKKEKEKIVWDKQNSSIPFSIESLCSIALYDSYKKYHK